MNDALLKTTHREEALSRVYARAVVAGAGYVTSDCDFDIDGVDLRIHAGGAMRPTVDLQLKATVNLIESKNGYCHFPLKRRNYDLLRLATQTPRLLLVLVLVLHLPRDESRWITITPDELILRRRAYWLSLRGSEASGNQSSVTVHIPTGNVFDVESLRALMEQSRGGNVR